MHTAVSEQVLKALKSLTPLGPLSPVSLLGAPGLESPAARKVTRHCGTQPPKQSMDLIPGLSQCAFAGNLLYWPA